MAEKKEGADRRMIETAKKIVRKKGFSGLRIRDLTDEAAVNLGMFHYHFRSKEKFARLVLQEIYEEFFHQLSQVSIKIEEDNKKSTSLSSRSMTDSDLLRLRQSLFVIGKFVRDNRGLMGSLVKDMFLGDAEVWKFGRKNIPRHAQLVGSILKKCQDSNLLPRRNLLHAMTFIMSALNVPTLVAEVLETEQHRSSLNLESILSDEAISDRVEMILQGLGLGQK